MVNGQGLRNIAQSETGFGHLPAKQRVFKKPQSAGTDFSVKGGNALEDRPMDAHVSADEFQWPSSRAIEERQASLKGFRHPRPADFLSQFGASPGGIALPRQQRPTHPFQPILGRQYVIVRK